MLINAVMTTAIIMLITGAAAVFGWIITTENVPTLLRELLLGIKDQRWVILLALNIVLLILGCFFDITAIVLVFTPVILPVLKAFQIDLVHWGVVQTLNVCIGFVTPPFGVGLFLLADMTGRPVMQVARNISPFLLPLVAAMITIT
jgi:TRAP-type C4-dicarboxylate transport system permease large subunit